MSIVECRAWSVACCVSRVACRILLSLLATHALATGLASGANVGCEDLTLDGKGALLVFWRKHPKDWDAKDGGLVGEGVNLFLNRCRRVRVENLTMDWDWGVAPLGFLGVCVDKHIDEADNVWCEGTDTRPTSCCQTPERKSRTQET